MAITIKDAIWQSCELLVKEKNLITIKNIKLKLYSLGFSNEKLDSIEHDITPLISQWRITKLNNSRKNATADTSDFNIYKALAIPKKTDDKSALSNMQKKIFALEHELNKYKHAACRANTKTKLLEKKLHTIIANVKRERQEFIADLKGMLLKQ